MTRESELNSPILQSDSEARAWLERILWPHGPVCPHCGTLNEATLIGGEKHSHRDGLYMCNACRKQFTVTVGTIFERSHVPLHKWVQAALLLAASKKGISSHQLHRILRVTYKTAWFMSMRLREAMREPHHSAIGFDPAGTEGRPNTAHGSSCRNRDKHGSAGSANNANRRWGIKGSTEQ